MAATTKLTETMIRAGASPQSYARGEEYYQGQAIYNTELQGNMLLGECEGSEAPGYSLQVELDAAGVRSAICSCPYDWGGYCKHIVALLLTYVRKPEAFVERKELPELLANLDRDQLVVILDKLLQRQPELRTWLECETEKPATKDKSKHERKTAVSLESYRRQIEAIFRSVEKMRPSQAYWAVGGMVEELREVIDTGCQFLENGDAESALAILLMLAEEAIEHFDFIDDSDGTLGDFAGELDMPLAEAILSAEMEESERRKIIDKLNRLAKHYSEYGMDDVLDTAVAAAIEGWENNEINQAADELKLQLCADEENTPSDQWIDQDDLDQDWEEDNQLTVAENLTEAKLTVLERQGKVEEYLALSQSAGQHLRYTLKLLDLSRFDEALTCALSNFGTAGQALIMAQQLRNLGRIDEAILLAEHGLSLAGQKFHLAQWLGPIEETNGKVEKAIDAYRIAFGEQPSLEGYIILQRLAASQWNEMRPRLIEVLEHSHDNSVKADVLLYEKEWDAAIAIAEKRGEWDYPLVEKIVEAVMPHRPDWVIRACKQQAELLIDKKQSKYYRHVVPWLVRMKEVCARNKRVGEWQTYLAHLRTEYSRRSSLMAELRQL